eukprot:09948.XXX_67055_67444_1 [CDS] Oithona nana genome sequencing.
MIHSPLKSSKNVDCFIDDSHAMIGSFDCSRHLFTTDNPFIFSVIEDFNSIGWSFTNVCSMEGTPSTHSQDKLKRIATIMMRASSLAETVSSPFVYYCTNSSWVILDIVTIDDFFLEVGFRHLAKSHMNH